MMLLFAFLFQLKYFKEEKSKYERNKTRKYMQLNCLRTSKFVCDN